VINATEKQIYKPQIKCGLCGCHSYQKKSNTFKHKKQSFAINFYQFFIPLQNCSQLSNPIAKHCTGKHFHIASMSIALSFQVKFSQEKRKFSAREKVHEFYAFKISSIPPSANNNILMETRTSTITASFFISKDLLLALFYST